MTLLNTTGLPSHRLLKGTALILLLGLTSLPAQAAGDAALYPSAPKGSTFIRVYNAGSSEISASVGNTQLKDIAPLGSTAFSFMPQGNYTARLGSQSLQVTLAGDHYYTLVNHASGQPQLVEEVPFKNKQKSLVRVQNLSDQALSLKTADGRAEVVQAVAARGTGEREVNPVKIGLALYSGERKVSDLKPIALQRGEAAVLYVTGSGSNLSPVWVKPQNN